MRLQSTDDVQQKNDELAEEVRQFREQLAAWFEENKPSLSVKIEPDQRHKASRRR